MSTLILYGDLARAVRRESAVAVAHAWGVTAQTVTKWRRALGVPRATEGTSRLHRAYAAERTGRTLVAVWHRRQDLGLPDGRTTNGRRRGRPSGRRELRRAKEG
jgi:hypothetical protein